jgi:hypothetical protein
MKKLAFVVTAVLVLAESAFPATVAVWDGTVPNGCAKLLPKGGGTVVNGTFVKLRTGQVLLSCNTAPVRTPPSPPDTGQEGA